MCKGNNIPPGLADGPSSIIDPATATKISSTSLKTISKSELAQHNTPASAWCAIHAQDSSTGKYTNDHVVVDITNFASKHPGGDLILLAAGKDASVLFETYHPRGVPSSLVKKLQIGVMEKGSYDSSFYSWDSDFYKVLRSRVVQRLEERGLNRRGSLEIWIKALLLLTGFWFSLVQMYTNTDNFFVATMWSITMGFFAAMIGINIQHDGNHGAFATSKFVNKAAGWTLDMIGASAFTWEFQHMLGHHPYTNVLDEVEESKKESGEDCKIEEKDQVCTPIALVHMNVWTMIANSLSTLHCIIQIGVGSRCLLILPTNENAPFAYTLVVSSLSTSICTIPLCFDDTGQSLSTRL